MRMISFFDIYLQNQGEKMIMRIVLEDDDRAGYSDEQEHDDDDV